MVQRNFLQRITHFRQSVFLSYNRYSQEEAEQLAVTLKKKKVRVVFDKQDLKQGDVWEFMRRHAAENNFVVLLITHQYLQSDYCMYEAAQLFSSGAYQKKLLLLIDEKLQADQPDCEKNCTAYWLQQISRIEKDIRENPYSEVAHERLKLLVKIKDYLPDLFVEIRQNKWYKASENAKAGYKELLAAIKPQKFFWRMAIAWVIPSFITLVFLMWPLAVKWKLETIAKKGKTLYNKQKYVEAFPLLYEAKDLEDPDVCTFIGCIYDFGYGVDRNEVEAVKWYQKGAKSGNAMARNNLGTKYLFGQAGLPKDEYEAVRLYLEASDSGFAVASTNLSNCFLKGDAGLPQEPTEKFKLWWRAANKGSYIGQFNLGVMYYLGISVDTNYQHAKYWFTKSAGLNDSKAMNALAQMSERGDGLLLSDYDEAFRWYKKSASLGDPDGQVGIGTLYYLGHGVQQNYDSAAYWYQKAAVQNNAPGQNNLGELYKDGKGVTKNMITAFNWFYKAALQGNPDAACSVAEMFETGTSISKNLDSAFSWYTKSALGGHPKAIKKIAQLKNKHNIKK